MKNNRIETAKMMMSFYNSLAGTSFRIGDNQRKINIITDAVNRGDVADLKNHIRRYISENPETAKTSAMTCFEMYIGKEDTPNKVSEAQVGTSLGILEQAVSQIIAQTQADEIKTQIMGNVQQTIKDFIKEEYGTITHNRARGAHLLDPMKKIIKELLESGKTVEEISKQLGMSKEEIFRLSGINRDDFLDLLAGKTYSEAILLTKI